MNIFQQLASLAGIERCAGIYPYLDADHAEYLGSRRFQEAAKVLICAAHKGMLMESDALEHYLREGEMRAAQELAKSTGWLAEQVRWTQEYARLQSELESKSTLVMRLAASLDRELVPCDQSDTWERLCRGRLGELELYSDYPGCQLRSLGGLEKNLRDAMEAYKAKLAIELDASEQSTRSADLPRASKEAAVRQLSKARDSLHNGNLITCRRSIEATSRILLYGASPAEAPTPSTSRTRLPASERRYPKGESSQPFVDVIRAAQEGKETWFLPTPEHRTEALGKDGFVRKHYVGGSEQFDSTSDRPDSKSGATYFRVFRKWLDMQEDGANSAYVASMPSIMNAGWWSGAKHGGRATFLLTEPTQGRPFYEDSRGRTRVMAVLRVGQSTAEDIPLGQIERMVRNAVGELIDRVKEVTEDTENERQFREDGLIAVLLPGRTLTLAGDYSQFCRRIPLPGEWRERVAYFDDLDLIRLLPIMPQSRLEGLLQLLLPRFPLAKVNVYRDSGAVNQYMFFGRDGELQQLAEDVTVVFSGRKMGKSSLLNRFHGLARDHTATVYTSVAGIAPWQSWSILNYLGQEIQKVLLIKSPQTTVRWNRLTPSLNQSAPDVFRQMLGHSKEQFEQYLRQALDVLKAQGVDRLYVLIDEADGFAGAERVENSGVESSTTAAVSWFLKDLEMARHRGAVRFIFAGFDELGQTDGRSYSAFGNWRGRLSIGRLEPKHARDLIQLPLGSLGIIVSDALTERILDYTSGHASLIQLFCQQLLDAAPLPWPLQDVELKQEDVDRVWDRDYQSRMESTLQLNLDLARLFPLKVIFYGIVSPVGLGMGKRLNLNEFNLADVERQLVSDRMTSNPFPTADVQESLKFLCQLGLLVREKKEPNEVESYRVEARHWANVLRTRNNFESILDESVKQYQQRSTLTAPRQIWNLDERALVSLLQETPVCVVAGLPGSGRRHLAKLMAPDCADSAASTCLLSTEDPSWADQLKSSLERKPAYRRVVVCDLDDRVPWVNAREWLLSWPVNPKGPALRWIAGGTSAWHLSNDIEVYASIMPVYMSPLSEHELGPWSAGFPVDEQGNDLSEPMHLSPSDRSAMIKKLGGVPTVLELLRKHFSKRMPDPVELGHVNEFLHSLQTASATPNPISIGLPRELREGIQLLLQACDALGQLQASRQELGTAGEMFVNSLSQPTDLTNSDRWDAIVESMLLLGLAQELRSGSTTRIQLPAHDQAIGILLRKPSFVI